MVYFVGVQLLIVDQLLMQKLSNAKTMDPDYRSAIDWIIIEV